jgi:hypothetical protein
MNNNSYQNIQNALTLAGIDPGSVGPVVYQALMARLLEDRQEYARNFHFDLMRGGL